MQRSQWHLRALINHEKYNHILTITFYLCFNYSVFLIQRNGR